MIRDIREDIEKLLEHELTTSSAKMKVLINGLNPITTETIVYFPDGSEALVTLEYKYMKNHDESWF